MKSNLDVHLSKPGQLHFVQVHFTTDEVRPSSVKIFFSGTWRSSSVHNKDTVRDRTRTTREVVWSIHLTYCTSGETSLVHECLFVKNKKSYRTFTAQPHVWCGILSPQINKMFLRGSSDQFAMFGGRSTVLPSSRTNKRSSHCVLQKTRETCFPFEFVVFLWCTCILTCILGDPRG
jgi:hypothetical protein